MFKNSFLPIIFSTLAMTQIIAVENAPALNAPVVDALAQQQSVEPMHPNQVKRCESYAKTMRVAGRHIEGGGIGYNKGYSTLEIFFAPSPTNWDLLPFLNLRGHVFNDGRLAANAGIGFRLLRGCRIYGINGYYDYRKTKHQHYNQFTLGLETLGDLWDFRINGYLPFGDKKSKPFGLRFDHFSGNEIILSERVEYAMKGGDAELGFHFGKTANWDSWIAAGPYYFIGELGGPRWGGKGRIGVTFREYVTLEFINSWDSSFHYRPQAQITLAWPFGPNAKTKRQDCPCSLSERLIQPIQRQEIIVVDKANKDTVAINPVTDLPFFVIFVDNTSSSNGTFESPYASLTQAQTASLPGDIIYVLPGNGTTANMNMGIVLQPNQVFWGSGVSHELITTLGTVDISAQTVTNPLITSTTGSAITLANNNDVSGFSITRPLLHGVNGSNVTNISLSNLWIFAAQNNVNGGNGVNIIENNGITNNIALSNLFITNNAKNGIFIETDGTSSANLLIENSTVTTNGAGVNTSAGIVVSSTMASNMNALLQNNFIINNANTGLLLDSASTGTLNYLLANNTIEDQNSFGISGLFTGNSSVTATLTGNTITRNIGPNQFSFIGPALFTAQNNHFDQIQNSGCELTAGNSTFSAIFTNNSLNGNSGGLIFGTNGTQNVTFTLESNDISYNCGQGLELGTQPGAVLNVEMLDNTINGNCNEGVVIAGNAAFLSVIGNNNVISGNCGPGLAIATGTITTGLVVDLNNNTIIENCDTGVIITPIAVPSYTLTATNNTVGGNSNNSIILDTKTGNALLTLSDNLLQGQGQSGSGGALSIQSSPSGTNNIAITCQNNQISNSVLTEDGIHFTYTGTNTGTNAFIASNNNVTNSRNGIFVDIVNGASGQSIGIDISNNSTAYNTANGIQVFASATNSFTANTILGGNTCNNNDINGILIIAQGATILNALADKNTLFNNNPLGTSDMLVNHNSLTGSVCLNLLNNTSNVGYTLTNAGGTFNLAPINAQTVNIGTITTSGTITPVATCP